VNASVRAAQAAAEHCIEAGDQLARLRVDNGDAFGRVGTYELGIGAGSGARLVEDVPKFVVPRSHRCEPVPLISRVSVFIQSRGHLVYPRTVVNCVADQRPVSNSMGRVVGPLNAVSGFHGAGTSVTPLLIRLSPTKFRSHQLHVGDSPTHLSCRYR
jgi:hypothetical protein